MHIALRYKPYDFSPGTSCLIPGSKYAIKAYPTAFFLFSETEELGSIHLDFKGLVKDFVVMQDLENYKVYISGFALSGFFCFVFYEELGELWLKLERGPIEGLHVEAYFGNDQSVFFLLPKEKKKLFKQPLPSKQIVFEKISFGSHKALDWTKIQKRRDPKEYLPLWYALAQSSLFSTQNTSKELLPFSLERCEELFVGFFEGMMLPKTHSAPYLGLGNEKNRDKNKFFDLSLLSGVHQMIRSTLFIQNGGVTEILPNLPSSFDSGRALNMQGNGAVFDLEWSKKTIKKLKITVFQEQTFCFSFQKGLKSFRIKADHDKNRQRYFCEDAVELQPGFYLLDQFQK